jgi:Arylsulfotransferase (ASST)
LLRAGGWMLAMLLVAGPGAAVAQGQQPTPHPSFSTSPALDPAFAWQVHDYAVRCNQSPVSIHVTLPAGWQGKVQGGPLRSTDFTSQRSLSAGRAVVVSFYPSSDPSSGSYFHVRCLPRDFPPYNFVRTGPGGPEFFMLQMNHNYATIFDQHGVPIWWFKSDGSPINAQVLPDGTVAWVPVKSTSGPLTGAFVIRTLEGQFVRTVNTVGAPTTDLHELQLLPGGNYLLAGQVTKSHVDTNAYGGSADASVLGFEVQEVTPHGRLVWKWDSLHHIGLGQTPTRWWNVVVGQPQPYDIQHWNSAEADGKYVLLSFRNLDAVYEINRRTGDIAWKLGGTPTPKSLTVLNDPYGSYPLGGQHDARRLPDGTISIHDNLTDLNAPPRAVRYQIDPQAGTADLVQSITDPDAPESSCCGSARMLPSGDWLIGWGRNPFVGAYNSSGQRIFKLQVPGGTYYRASPVPPHELTAQRLRQAMNTMAPRPPTGQPGD